MKLCMAIAGSLLLSASVPARAQVATATRALWLVHGFEPAEASQLQAVLGPALEARLIGAGEVGAELEAVAEILGPDPEAIWRERTRAAHEAFVELRLAEARRAYQQGLDALLAGDRRPAAASQVAELLFQRALVALAAHDRPLAARELQAMAVLDPRLAPDPDVYGPPALRAVAEAQRAASRLPLYGVRVERAPADAVVRLDGVVVPAGALVRVRGRGPHLLTAERSGHRARSRLLDVEPRPESTLAVVLERASGPLLAAQLRDAWRTRGEGAEPLAGEDGVSLARTLGIARVLECARLESGEVDLVLRDAESGEVMRSVRGRRVDWEPLPYAALAAALAGRTLEPPPAPVELTLSLAAPSRVLPGASIPLEVDVRDPGRKLARLEARCGAAMSSEAIAGGAHSAHTLVFEAPEDEGTLSCEVRGLDGAGVVQVSAPPAGSTVEVAIKGDGLAWYERWYVWGAIGMVVAGGAAAAFILRPEAPPPEQVLVIDGPR